MESWTSLQTRYLGGQFDAAVGGSIRDNVLDAYRFISQRLEPQDKLFLFGFSRGAYTVRALAALINRCGLLLPDYSHLCEYAWSGFSDEDRSKGQRRILCAASRL